MSIRDVKLCLLGSSGVGKTSLVLRFHKNAFEEGSQPTIGASFTQKDIVLDDGGVIRYKIWDTAGQEKFRGLTPMYFRGAEVAILVYDITRQASFDELSFWISELKKQTSGEPVLAIAANKSDLEGDRQVSHATAEEFAHNYGAILLETSAKNSSNVDELFTEIASKLPAKEVAIADPSKLKLRAADQPAGKPGCAC